ncbi:hypothetical protein C0033_13220 [Clostridium sp. chh4-2]|nr:hypothetical protein C0033_13220 [Clostridium sp. chh4-2]
MRIIGLDFGHCEIAAAMIQSMNGEAFRVMNLFLDGNKNTVIPAEAEYHGELFNYFKASPKHFNEQIRGNEVTVMRRDLISLLFRKVMDGIMEYNTEIADGEQILLVVGCPASEEWTAEKSRNEYEQLIKKATGAAEVRVIPESRAAMFSALADGKGRMISAGDGAVVYDFGSSTADSTYMKSGERCVEVSWNLGARAIEKTLSRMMCCEASEKADRLGLDIVPSENYANLERRLRAVKEAYFNGSLDEESSVFAWKFSTAGGKKLTAILDIDDELMDRALGEEEVNVELNGALLAGSWKYCCKEFFRKSKTLIEENYSVKEIVLTGGASKMDFIAQYARKIFPEPKYVVTCSPNPCFSVSQGLIWAGLVDDMEKECVAAVKKAVISSNISGVGWLKDRMKYNMGEKISKVVFDVADASIKADCKDFNLEKTMEKVFDPENIKDQQERIERGISGIMDEIRSDNKECIRKWTSGIIKEIRIQLEHELQKRLGAILAQKMTMPENMWDSLNLNLEKLINADKIINGMIPVKIKCPSRELLVDYKMKVISTLAVFGIMKDTDTGRGMINGVKKTIKEIIHTEQGFWISKAVDSAVTDSSLESHIEAITKNAYEIMTLKFEV